jgi:peptide/nickel transport system substrate-binding protein/oligopeptide transport system substrate-binding protein
MKKRCLTLIILLALTVGQIIAQDLSPEEFVTYFSDSPPQMDPHLSIFSQEAQIFTALYEGLFSYDPASLDPIPAAVSSWKKSKDGLIYTFTIRENAQWSDGEPLLASDFRNAWIRLLRNNAQYAAFFDIIAGAKAFRLAGGKDEAGLGLRATDRKTLTVTLERPADYFTRLLCHHSFSPIHPSMLESANWTSRIPFPVNGPYQFVSFDKEGLVLEKNPRYWDSKSVSIPKLRFVFTDDDDAASRAFNDDRAHWLAGPGNYDAILAGAAIQVNPIFSTNYWYFNCLEAPWNNPDLRKGLALLLPWKAIRDPEHYVQPATTLVLPLPGYDKARGIEAQDRAEAMKALEKAGFPEGKGLPEIKILFAESKDSRRVATLFKTAWSGLTDLKVTLEPVNPSKYYEMSMASGRSASTFTLAHTTWIGDFADPEAFLQMWMPDSPLNEAKINDPEFAAIMEKSYSAEGQKRLELLAAAETELLGNAAVLPIYHGMAASVIDLDYIEGWFQNALDIHPYKYMRFGSHSIKPNVARMEISSPADFEI